MYRIRFHGRGGQGMKTASRLLGAAFFREGYEVQDAPRYGAERRGAPIFAYVRADRVPINERGIIRHPDLVIVADDSLVPVPAAGVWVTLEKGVQVRFSLDPAGGERSKFGFTAAGVLASAGASVLAAIVAIRLFELPYEFNPWLWITGVGAGILVVCASGYIAARSAVNAAPVDVLRAA